jgi:predicted permease
MSLRDIRVPGIRRALRIARKSSVDWQVEEELRFHIDERTEQLMREGLTREEALRRAVDEFGDLVASRRELSRIDHRRLGADRREEMAMSFSEDLRYAARSLWRRPSLLAITTITLSLGIAANAVMFGVVDQLLLRPPAHVVDADAVKRINFSEMEDGKPFVGPVTTYPVVTALRKNTTAFEELAAFGFKSSYTLGRGRDARNLSVLMVSGNFFRLLGVRPAIGRLLLDSDDRVPDGESVLVLSDGAWRTQFGGDTAVIGRTVILQNRPFTIVGVTPKDFAGIDRENIDAWVPISAVGNEALGPGWHNTADNWWASIIGRVKRDRTMESAAQEATIAYRRVRRELKDEFRGDTAPTVVLSSIIGTRAPTGVSRESKVSLWLLGVSAIVLLIACSNVANLLIARTLERRREIAVRIALGVSRSRLVRMLLAEAGLLAAISAAVALVIGFWGGRFVQGVLLPEIAWSDSVLDLRVLAFTMGIAGLCVLLAGIVPALQGSRTNVADGLKASARQVAGGGGRVRFALLLTQAALSMILLVGAGLFVRSLRNVATRDIGVDRDRVLRVTMPLSRFGFEQTQIDGIYRRGADRIRTLAGVSGVSLVGMTYPMGGASAHGFSVPGAVRPRFEHGGPYNSLVEPGYFETMGARLIAGRDFTVSEVRNRARVVIVNETLATGYWPNESPIGKCVTFGDDKACSRVIGVVNTMLQFAIVKDERAIVYAPFTHPGMPTITPAVMFVRLTKANPAIVSSIRREIQALAPTMPFVQVRSVGELLEPQMRPWRLGALMFTLFGTIAVVIAAIGLYSVLAYWVSQRTHEIGVRMALGAQRGDVIRLVAAQSSKAVAIGLLIALPITLLGSRWIADMLYETSPRDPMVYLGAGLVLALATLAATIVPARRSSAVDPAQAIRTD